MGKHKKLRVGITSGDTNGVGLEVALKSLSDARMYEHCAPVIYASKETVNQHLKALGLEGIHFHSIESPEKLNWNNANPAGISVEI